MKAGILVALCWVFLIGCSPPKSTEVPGSSTVGAWSRVVIAGDEYITLTDLEKKAKDAFAADGQEVPAHLVASFVIGGEEGFVAVRFATGIGESMWVACFDKNGNILTHSMGVARG